MGIVCRGAMHGFAAVPSAIMWGSRSLRRQVHCCAIHSGGWEGRKPQNHASHPYKQYPYPIRARFSSLSEMRSWSGMGMGNSFVSVVHCRWTMIKKWSRNDQDMIKKWSRNARTRLKIREGMVGPQHVLLECRSCGISGSGSDGIPYHRKYWNVKWNQTIWMAGTKLMTRTSARKWNQTSEAPTLVSPGCDKVANGLLLLV